VCDNSFSRTCIAVRVELMGVDERLELMTADRDHWKSRCDAVNNELNSTRKVAAQHAVHSIELCDACDTGSRMAIGQSTQWQDIVTELSYTRTVHRTLLSVSAPQIDIHLHTYWWLWPSMTFRHSDVVRVTWLTLWCPLLPYRYRYKALYARSAFVSDAQPWASECRQRCQKLQMTA